VCRPTFPYINCTDYSFSSSTFALGLVVAQSSSYTSTTSNGVTTTTSSSSFVAEFAFYHIEALSVGTCTRIIEETGVNILAIQTTTTCVGNVDVYINGALSRKSGVSMATGYPVLNVQVQCPNPIGYNVS
jgi:hypothetical protein